MLGESAVTPFLRRCTCQSAALRKNEKCSTVLLQCQLKMIPSFIYFSAKICKRRASKRQRSLLALFVSGKTAHRGARASPSQIYTSIKTALRIYPFVTFNELPSLYLHVFGGLFSAVSKRLRNGSFYERRHHTTADLTSCPAKLSNISVSHAELTQNVVRTRISSSNDTAEQKVKTKASRSPIVSIRLAASPGTPPKRRQGPHVRTCALRLVLALRQIGD
jgi:hypothetical protein